MSAYGFVPGVSTTGALTINEELCPTVRAQANTNTPAVVMRTAQTGANGSGIQDELAHTIDTTGPEAVAYAVRMRAGCAGGGKGALVQEGVSGTLATGNDQTVFQPVDFRHAELGDGTDATQTLQAKSTGGYSLNYMPGATDGYVVRRLTPLECERLQGFPDGWTDIGDWVDSKGKRRKTTDGNRYKALGNSFAVPVVRLIGERIERMEMLEANNNYRKARMAAGVRAESAASELGVSITTLFSWERGDTKPNGENIRAMAKLYSVSADYLLGLDM